MAIIITVIDDSTNKPIPYCWVKYNGVQYDGNELGQVDVESGPRHDGSSKKLYVGATGYNSEEGDPWMMNGGGSKQIDASTTNDIHGHIIDCDSNVGIEGATVQWGTKTATTNYNGFYKILNPESGSRNLTSTKSGYSDMIKAGNYITGGWEINGCMTADEVVEDLSGFRVYSRPDTSSAWSLQHFYPTLAEAESLRDTLEAANTLVRIVEVSTEGVEIATVYESTPPPDPSFHNRVFGVVKGPLNTPVQYATITFAGKSAITNQEGEFNLYDVFASGSIVCAAYGYEPKEQIIEAPASGDLEVNFSLTQHIVEQPSMQPLADSFDGGSNKIVDMLKQGLPENLDPRRLERLFREAGLPDWADKADEILSELTSFFSGQPQE